MTFRVSEPSWNTPEVKAELERYFSVRDSVLKAVELAKIEVPEPPRSQTYNQRKSDFVYQKRPVIRMEINSADSLDLLDLPGIGLVFASRIVRYRERLGGFYDLSQLLSVYGMDSARFQRIAPLLDLDTNYIRKIRINQADYQELRSHPMLSNKMAALIVNYRQQHGYYSSLEDMLQIKPLDEEILRNIAPYLEFQ